MTITPEDFAVAVELAEDPKSFRLVPGDYAVLDQKTYKKIPIREDAAALLSQLLLGNGHTINLLGLAKRMKPKRERAEAAARKLDAERSATKASLAEYDCGCG